MAEKEFKLPDVGEGVAEGELVNWLVAPGDTVTEDQPVAEVETDKALVEVPSPYNGTVKQLHVEEGQMVPVGDVIVTYDVPEAGDDVSDADASKAAADEAAEPAPESEPAADAGAATEAEPADEAPEPASGRVFAPPSARRLARELGVDIATVDGSGPGGRVTEGDVRAHAESGGAGDDGAGDAAESSGPKPIDIESTRSAVSKAGDAGTAGVGAVADDDAPSPTPSSVEAAGRDRTLAVPATRKAARDAGVDLNDVPTDETRDGEAFVTADQVTQYAQTVTEAKAAEAADTGATGGADETGASTADPDTAAGNGAAAGSREPESVPYRGVRRTIGEQMETSKYTAPHVTHHDTAVVDDLVDVRADLKERAAERDVRLSYMPFVMKALVAGLKEFPSLNSELREDDEEILLKKEYNLGIAVATDAGLMVPVVKHVDEKSILELAAEVNDLAARARDRKVSREEMQGGTFTITNFGAIGGEYATPIINYPETAIMGLGAIDERPVAEDGEVRAAHTLPLSLSIDHRVIDGAEAGQFTNFVMERLENPSLLLLE
ncbi:2-oxo acid dehydrogenase subunit E2 [Halobaculum gomorrense]|uniref:Pyruvate dehydrogenase E2 component (Dihydrolipoamide acetyltransferase) n=1 Tax=Halobaculum gomorrense TaxID=43928 RepID=A0A1M5SXZ0_9EURY|nr:2-oxo acid dehydrogenase subunit E2 [Halobaculum gomorrense]SHH43316.1 pyruvate dehydrogenase E2 component (dihydrolipoamide acetyltransferase) [Halobaculum gomorrense]